MFHLWQAQYPKWRSLDTLQSPHISGAPCAPPQLRSHTHSRSLEERALDELVSLRVGGSASDFARLEKHMPHVSHVSHATGEFGVHRRGSALIGPHHPLWCRTTRPRVLTHPDTQIQGSNTRLSIKTRPSHTKYEQRFSLPTWLYIRVETLTRRVVVPTGYRKYITILLSNRQHTIHTADLTRPYCWADYGRRWRQLAAVRYITAARCRHRRVALSAPRNTTEERWLCWGKGWGRIPQSLPQG